jgi:YesN/AraC family two-component response regulator
MLHMLVVDDTKAECDCIKYLLEEYDASIQTDTARDGWEAIELISDKQYDILFTDIRMPRRDGLELSRLALEKIPELKIIIFSGYHDFDYAKQAIKLGVKDYLLKPVNTDEFHAVLQRTLEDINRQERNKQLEVLLQAQAGSLEEDTVTKDRIRLISEHIASHFQDDLHLEDLARLIYVHPDYLCRIFKQVTGMTINKYIRKLRMKEAVTLLRMTHMKVSDIGKKVGYANPSYFIQAFREFYGVSPDRYRQKDV